MARLTLMQKVEIIRAAPHEPVADIAARYDITPGAVYYHIRQNKDALSIYLKEHIRATAGNAPSTPSAD